MLSQLSFFFLGSTVNWALMSLVSVSSLSYGSTSWLVIGILSGLGFLLLVWLSSCLSSGMLIVCHSSISWAIGYIYFSSSGLGLAYDLIPLLEFWGVFGLLLLTIGVLSYSTLYLPLTSYHIHILLILFSILCLISAYTTTLFLYNDSLILPLFLWGCWDPLPLIYIYLMLLYNPLAFIHSYNHTFHTYLISILYPLGSPEGRSRP